MPRPACSLAYTCVTSAGLCALALTHSGRLALLRFDGCAVALCAVLHALRHQRRVCMWDERARGHLPRWINTAHTLLFTATEGGERRWRLAFAREPSWPALLTAGAVTAGVLVAHGCLLLVTALGLLLLPLAFTMVGLAVLAAAACGRPVPQRSLLGAAARGEVLLSAALVGVLSCHVPPPPTRPVWDF